MLYTVFTDKEQHKYRKELLELHIRCCTAYLKQRSLKHNKIKKFFVIYSNYIDEDNIEQYFNRPIALFVQALVLDQLDYIVDYVKPETKKKRKKRHNKS
jgi:hypothetical protein|nr:MAG TPA: hypothetical protein [Caudoviricetes sp.]